MLELLHPQKERVISESSHTEVTTSPRIRVLILSISRPAVCRAAQLLPQGVDRCIPSESVAVATLDALSTYLRSIGWEGVSVVH